MTIYQVVEIAGHIHGDASIGQQEAINNVDQSIHHLIQGLEERALRHVNLMVVSDHG